MSKVHRIQIILGYITKFYKALHGAIDYSSSPLEGKNSFVNYASGEPKWGINNSGEGSSEKIGHKQISWAEDYEKGILMS